MFCSILAETERWFSAGLLTNSTMPRGSPLYTLNHSQFAVAKYAVLTNKSIHRVRQELVDRYNNPIYDTPCFIPTGYLNRTTLTNIKTALKSFRRNPKGKSTYTPLPEGWTPLDQYQVKQGVNRQDYPGLTAAQHRSQFEPPTAPPEPELEEADYNSSDEMVRFSHLQSAPPLPTATNSNALVNVRTTSEDGLAEATYRLRGPVTIGGYSSKWQVEMHLTDAVATAFFPGGGGFQAYLGQNVFNVNGQKLAGLTIVCHYHLPVNNAVIFEHPPLIVSPDTVLVPIPTGIIPNTLVDLKLVLPLHSSRLGDRLENSYDVLDAFGTDATDRGFKSEYIALTFKGLPCNLSMDNTFQDEELRSIHKQALKGAVNSCPYDFPDTLVPNVTHSVNGTT
jgi:hypothetical protein